MNGDKFMDAIGLIDDEFIAEARETKAKKFKAKKVLALVAALIILFVLGVTTIAKEFNYNLDQVLYDTFSYVAEKLKPVNLSCEDNGIKMEVISAKREGKRAYIYISMQDLEKNRIDETIDLYDSVFIRLPSGYSGSCTKIGFDEETKKATFLITIDQNGELKIPWRKVSFSVGCFLSGRIEPEGFVDEIDLSSAEINPEYETDVTGYKRLKDKFEPDSLQNKIYHFAYERIPGVIQNILDLNDWYFEYESYDEETEKYLSSNEVFYTSETGAEFVAMGFIDNKLHIKVYYGNRHYSDHIGFLTVFDKYGKEIPASEMKYIRNFGEIEQNYFAPVETWVDYTFDISPKEIEGCRLYEKYWKYQNYVEGDWKIRFRIP